MNDGKYTAQVEEQCVVSTCTTCAFKPINLLDNFHFDVIMSKVTTEIYKRF